jgi:hypothetical protein
MAPSEFDLRAALREGEGDGPDVNDVIMAAESRRAQRRVRLLSTAVVVAVVGGLAAGAAELGSSGGSSSNGSEAAAGAGQAANGDALHGAAGAPLAPAAKRALDSVPCPSAAPHYAVNAGGLNSGGAAQLVSGQVRTVVVCAYGPAFYTASAPAHRPARL